MKALLVDDREQDRLIAARLQAAGLSCDAMAPTHEPTELVAAIRRAEVQLVLLDYRLDDTDANVAYRGGAVAALLREELPDVPVVVLSSGQNMDKFLRHNPAVRNLFDLRIDKADLSRDPQRTETASVLIDLAEGYQAVRKEFGARGGVSWKRVAELLGASEAESEVLAGLGMGAPPSTSQEAIGFILGNLLTYPGPLLDEGEARARLGISAETFRLPAVHRFLSRASYSGVFGGLRRRWWRGRLSRILGDLGEEVPSADSRTRAAAVGRASRARGVAPGFCVVCRGGYVSRACSVCCGSVDSDHCVEAIVNDARPTWAEAAVVCFKCIKTGKAADAAVTFPKASMRLVDSVKRGKL